MGNSITLADEMEITRKWMRICLKSNWFPSPLFPLQKQSDNILRCFKLRHGVFLSLIDSWLTFFPKPQLSASLKSTITTSKNMRRHFFFFYGGFHCLCMIASVKNSNFLKICKMHKGNKFIFLLHKEESTRKTRDSFCLFCVK